MILNGAMYRGVGDLAGEVGHWRIGPDLGPVHYGKRGSFEGYCSGSGIVGWYEYLGGTRPRFPLSAEAIAAGPAKARSWRCGSSTRRPGARQGIAILVDALAPELVIVGGIYGYATDLLQSGMRAAFAEKAHPRLAEGTKSSRPSSAGRSAATPVAASHCSTGRLALRAEGAVSAAPI